MYAGSAKRNRSSSATQRFEKVLNPGLGKPIRPLRATGRAFQMQLHVRVKGTAKLLAFGIFGAEPIASQFASFLLAA